MREKRFTKENSKVLDAISNLALAVGAGFDKVDKRFNKVDTELADIRQDISAV